MCAEESRPLPASQFCLLKLFSLFKRAVDRFFLACSQSRRRNPVASHVCHLPSTSRRRQKRDALLVLLLRRVLVVDGTSAPLVGAGAASCFAVTHSHFSVSPNFAFHNGTQRKHRAAGVAQHNTHVGAAFNRNPARPRTRTGRQLRPCSSWVS